MEVKNKLIITNHAIVRGAERLFNFKYRGIDKDFKHKHPIQANHVHNLLMDSVKIMEKETAFKNWVYKCDIQDYPEYYGVIAVCKEDNTLHKLVTIKEKRWSLKNWLKN